MPNPCAVRGCLEDATIVIQPFRHSRKAVDPADVRGTHSYSVCPFHEQAIVSGEEFADAPGTSGVRGGPMLIVGVDLPPKLLDYELHQEGIGGHTLTLILGRDGAESERVHMLISDELEDALFMTENILGDEIERNK
ncbi:hypothetical protein ACYX8G_14665 [Microbacterium saperdae]